MVQSKGLVQFKGVRVIVIFSLSFRTLLCKPCFTMFKPLLDGQQKHVEESWLLIYVTLF